MAEEADSGEKTEAPTAHRIDQFKKKGDVVSSQDVNSLLVIVTGAAMCFFSFGASIEQAGEFFEWIIGLDFYAAYGEKQLKTILIKGVNTFFMMIAPILLGCLVVGLVAGFLQVGPLFASEALKFDLNRVNPINGFKRYLSFKPYLELFKAFFKIIIVAGISFLFLKEDLYSFLGLFHQDVTQNYEFARYFIFKLGISILGGLTTIAAIDVIVQKIKYHNRLKMTKAEAKQEHKEQEGNPEVKQRIKSLQREMSQKRMMEDVKTADVIVTNPTHISVALKYDATQMVSPKVVAKGPDHLALRIREAAKASDIPIVENILLARTLYKTVKTGGAVPRELYKAVAEVLSFVYRLKKKKGIK